MSFDLLVKNANLPDGRTGIDIACQDGRIAAVEAGITAEAAQVIDADGQAGVSALRRQPLPHGRDACRSVCRA
jgi:predicted amidohydrolase